MDTNKEDDLEAIQAHLDMTMALTYEAVEASFKNSKLPDDMVYDTIETYKPRPPRLGVGATPREKPTNGTTPSLARETARLHGRLAGKKRNRDDAEGDITQPKAVTNGLKRLHLPESSDEDESRAATIVTKGKDKGKGKPFDKFSLPMRKKQQTNGVETTSPTKGDVNRVNPFSSKPLEDTRFVAPALPKHTPTPTGGDKIPSPQSPTRILSPSISRSSSTSRHSSTSRRMMLKHAAAASYRIISVELVSPVTSPTLSSDSSSSKPPAPISPSKLATPVLQLRPISPPTENSGAVETGEQKKKKRKKKKKKSAVPQNEQGKDGEGEDTV